MGTVWGQSGLRARTSCVLRNPTTATLFPCLQAADVVSQADGGLAKAAPTVLAEKQPHSIVVAHTFVGDRVRKVTLHDNLFANAGEQAVWDPATPLSSPAHAAVTSLFVAATVGGGAVASALTSFVARHRAK